MDSTGKIEKQKLLLRWLGANKYTGSQKETFAQFNLRVVIVTSPKNEEKKRVL